MREVLEHLSNIRWDETEVEEEYRKKLNQAVFGCGNIYSADEKITLYINGLSGTIRTVVARYHESVHRCKPTFETIAHFTKFEDQACCA